MKKGRSIIWGLVLVILGVILGINELGLFKFDIFFDGWWTLFIIIPCFIGLITDDNKTSSLIFLIIGILLLFSCQDIISFKLLGKLIIPIIIVIVGLSLIFKNIFNTNINNSIKKINSKSKPKEEYNAVFAGQKIKLDNEEFKGTSLNAIFGGIDIDLRDTIINEDIVITASAIFGGIDIFVPNNVNIKIKSNSVLGGVDNKNKNKTDDKNVTVYIDATCIFGGIDIK